jgi:hypothetical protein
MWDSIEPLCAATSRRIGAAYLTVGELPSPSDIRWVGYWKA